MESLEFYQIYDFCGRPVQKVCSVKNKDALQKFLKIYECTIADSKSEDKAFSNELEMFKSKLDEEYEYLKRLQNRLKNVVYFDRDSVIRQINFCQERIGRIENIIEKYQDV